MDDILSRFSINCHSSIRYAGAMTVWFDPFRVADAPCDADVVFVTHDHYDHFSPEDIHRVMKSGAVLVLPETCVAAALRARLFMLVGSVLYRSLCRHESCQFVLVCSLLRRVVTSCFPAFFSSCTFVFVIGYKQ